MDWSLLACGRSGHVTYAPAEPELREQLSIQTASGAAWRCLRCGTFVAGEPGQSGPARDAPRVRRGSQVRSAFILRVFAAERFLRGLVFLGLAYALWRFKYARQSVEAAFDREQPVVRSLFRQLGYNIDNSKLAGLIQHALDLSPGWITLLAAGLALYAIIVLIEGTGLWLVRRWGEYFAMVATSLGMPLEIYDLARKITITTLILFAINLALVLYLVFTKRLFGVRGGKRAYDARLRSESVLEAAVTAAGAAAEARAADSDGAAAATGAAGGPTTGAAGDPTTGAAGAPATGAAGAPATGAAVTGRARGAAAANLSSRDWPEEYSARPAPAPEPEPAGDTRTADSPSTLPTQS